MAGLLWAGVRSLFYIQKVGLRLKVRVDFPAFHLVLPEVFKLNPYEYGKGNGLSGNLVFRGGGQTAST